MNEIPKVVFSKKGFGELPSTELTTTAFTDASRVRMAEGLRPSPNLSPSAATWSDARVASGDLAEEITRLKQQPGKDILAHGGARFAQSLVRLGLVDEYRLLIHPAALGSGLPLFSTLSKPVDLRLISSTAFSAVAVAHVYRPA